MRTVIRHPVTAYCAVPTIVSVALIGAYFSGVDLLQSIVSPNWDLPNKDAPREFGLLENIQNVCLIAIIVIAFRATKDARTVHRFIFAGIGLFAAFVLLEELDYGLHYYELVTGWKTHDPDQVRNVHNIGDVDRFMKLAMDTTLILFFGILPLALRGSNNPWVRAYLPSVYCVLTLFVMLAMRTLAHGLQDAGVGNPGSIEKNLSEFRELNTYYLAMLYLYDIAHRPTD